MDITSGAGLLGFLFGKIGLGRVVFLRSQVKVLWLGPDP